jgi:hypothetical protein
MAAGAHGVDPGRSRRHHQTVVFLVLADGSAARLLAAAAVVLQDQVLIVEDRQRSVELKLERYANTNYRNVNLFKINTN